MVAPRGDGIDADAICASLRDAVQEGLSLVRQDLRTILREEMESKPVAWKPSGALRSPECSIMLAPSVTPSMKPSPSHSAMGASMTSKEALRERAQNYSALKPEARAHQYASVANFGVCNSLRPMRISVQPPSALLFEDATAPPAEPIEIEPEPPEDLPNTLPVTDDRIASKNGPPPRPSPRSLSPAPGPPLTDQMPPRPRRMPFSKQPAAVASEPMSDAVSNHMMTSASAAVASTSNRRASDVLPELMKTTWFGHRKEILTEAKERKRRELEELKAVDKVRKPPLMRRIREAVLDTPYFDGVCGLVVLLNASMLGVQVDWLARNTSSSPPYAFRILEIIFFLCFTLEWLVRFLVYGKRFFYARGVWHWHLFDTFLVGMQLMEEITVAVEIGVDAWVAPVEKSINDSTGNFSWLRILRFLRLVRVLRTVRVLRLVGELRTLVLSIMGSLRALVWAVVLLFLLMYVVGIFLTQVVLDHRMVVIASGHDNRTQVDSDLVSLYGSLGDSIYTVYMAITGGVDWGTAVRPLRSEISIYMVPLFMMYIAFACLCMMNVITGVFVESALASTKDDNHLFMMKRLHQLFRSADLDGDGRISCVEFFVSSDSPEIQAVFEQLELPLGDLELIFEALDGSGNGLLTVEEFVNGCQELAGPAKNLDVAALKSILNTFVEQAQDRDMHIAEHFLWVEKKLVTMSKAIHEAFAAAAVLQKQLQQQQQPQPQSTSPRPPERARPPRSSKEIYRSFGCDSEASSESTVFVDKVFEEDDV